MFMFTKPPMTPFAHSWGRKRALVSFMCTPAHDCEVKMNPYYTSVNRCRSPVLGAAGIQGVKQVVLYGLTKQKRTKHAASPCFLRYASIKQAESCPHPTFLTNANSDAQP